MPKLTVSMIAPAFPCYPVRVAEERGMFDAHGIRIEIELTGATDKVTTSLEKGHSQIAMVTPEGVIGNAAKAARFD